MKVYVADKYKIKNYLLPSKIEDSYLIQYVSPSGIEENITLTAENNKWTLNSNYDMSVQKDVAKINKDILSNNCFYQINFNDLNDPIYLYCFETPLNFANYEIGNKNEISFGRNNCDINYNHANVSDIHFKITKSNNYWLFQDDNTDFSITYINGVRAHKQYLNLGDVIFTNGVKMIWMDLYIMINNPNLKVVLKLPPYKDFSMLGKENTYTPVKETEKQVVLYKNNQTFFHTPRLKENSEEHNVKIQPPPEKFKDDGPPAILTLGATVMMGMGSSVTGVMAIFSVANNKANITSAITQIIVSGSMIIGSVIFPIFLDKYQKIRIKKKEKKRQLKYSKYLEEKKNTIQNFLTKETNILNQNFLSTNELEQNIIKRTNKIWSIEIQDNDFLSFRVGIGNKKANLKIETNIEEFSLEDDNLKKQVEEIKNTNFMLNNVPITISIVDNKVLPVIIDNSFPGKNLIIDNILLQLMTYYSGVDLKLVVLTTKENEKKWEYIKYLPHSMSNDKEIRFFSSNEDEMKQITSYLEKIYLDRYQQINFNKNNNNSDDKQLKKEYSTIYKNFDEYYLIITDDYMFIKNSNIIDKIVDEPYNLGFSLLMFEPTMQNLPSRINQVVEINPNRCVIFDKNLSKDSEYNFKPEYFNSNISYFAKIIANIPIPTSLNGNVLPKSLNFLEMYKVGKIEQLNILNRWEHSDPINTLHTPIGVHPNGKLFELDLHEKFHGPHGLIAGATGSGKSEFIITFILSLAINYHPYEVQFVLIDYKGGGLAGAFENKESGIKLPHLVGTITNLDTAEMNRTLVSINSELKRRQRMFNEARDKLNESTIDIYKYQKFYREGKVKEPISHLFIISDEFAELKAQQPDFMNELISTARIGRSLGVHLILATQKPSGVVDDQIWSNSRFKVALKVQTMEDSNELLKRPEAAYIKETGRFYLQVGYDELFEQGQSAWSGAKYNPTDRIIKSIDDSIDFIDNNGNIIKKINDKVKVSENVNYGDQLTNIVKTLFNLAKREEIKFNTLWLPSIPKTIYLSNTINKYKNNIVYNKFLINPIVGEYDDPKNQKQNVLQIDFTNGGNLVIYGLPGSGKENLILTTVYSTCIYHSPEEVIFYIMDFGAETLKNIADMPQVGDVILSDNELKIKSCLFMIRREINKRKELFSTYGGSYVSYISQSNIKLPLMMVILNGYENFCENFSNYEEEFASLLRDSAKYGIIFTMSVNATNSINSRISQNFNNIVMMQVADEFDYKFTLNAENGLKPAKNFGRGLTRVKEEVFEFQTAYIYEKNEINNIIRKDSEKLSNSYKKAKSVPIIPDKVNSNLLMQYANDIKSVPIGINIDNGDISRFDFSKNKFNQVLGNNILSDRTFITNFSKTLSSTPNIKVKIIDFAGVVNDSSLDYVNGEFTKNINEIYNLNDNAKIQNYYIIVGIGYINEKVLDEGIEKLYKLFNNIEKFKNTYFIFIDNLTSYRNIMNESWYKNINKENGIWIGNGIEVQNIINVNKVSKADASEEFEGCAYIIQDKKYTVIKSPAKKIYGDDSF